MSSQKAASRKPPLVMAGWCRGQLCQSIDPGSHEWLNNQPKVIWRWMVFRWFSGFQFNLEVDFWGAKAASIFFQLFFSQENFQRRGRGLDFHETSPGASSLSLWHSTFLDGGRCFFSKGCLMTFVSFFFCNLYGEDQFGGKNGMVFISTCNKNCKKLLVFCPKFILAKDHSMFFSWENQSWLWSCFFFELGLGVKAAFHAPNGCWDRLGWNGAGNDKWNGTKIQSKS